MPADADKAAIRDHQKWLGYLQPDGLVVSPAALLDSGVVIDRTNAERQVEYREFLTDPVDDSAPRLRSPLSFFTGFLGWDKEHIAGSSDDDELPSELIIALPDYDETLAPTYGLRNPRAGEGESPWLMLISALPTGTDLERPSADHNRGWQASPARKLERLLRETGIPIGLLTNNTHFSLIYAPRGENAGSLTFPVAAMSEIAGRSILSAFESLLGAYTLFSAPSDKRLLGILNRSRTYQARVSIDLSQQVLEALYELARGFQAANDRAGGKVLEAAFQRDPDEIYGGFTSTILRLVFLLYAEDRGLMPASALYQQHYAVHGLFEQLRSDHERYPDTMDERFGGWARLLVLFRVVHGGCRHQGLKLPARRGHLFDPDRFPYLEGRPDERSELDEIPCVSDGALYRILHLLLYLDGERLSYRTLDVEQIGSVYETIMGFHVENAPGRMIALKPKKKHGAPIHLSLDDLLAAKPAARAKLLNDQADTKLPAKPAKALKEAATLDDLLAALNKRIDRRATPHPVTTGSIILQPTDERRRSGSHYTPRSFTEPIVRKTLAPILDRLGRHPRPEVILDLKIADIAVGSAAFLVETCRQLADELVSSWAFHKVHQNIPPDEDELLYARRLVAQRCLYGVDRNPMAVDLAKLSLWLATMAKDHPFTFVDHAIKCGDSLVGLTNQQIAAFHWDPDVSEKLVLGPDDLQKRIQQVIAKRTEIIADPEDTEYAILRKQARLAEADAAAQKIKTTGDLAIAAFFAGAKPRERQQLRDEFLEKHLALQRGQNVQETLPWQTRTLHELRFGEHPIRPFHWEIEFPEVFSRENPGFDGIVGNPPFAGKNTWISGNRLGYFDWLKSAHQESHGNSDLVAHFFRSAFASIRKQGSLGLLATNTIGQGDTRGTGLRWICRHEGCIYAAQRRYRWPGQAAVVVSIVWISNGPNPPPFDLDGRPVDRITAYLFHQGGDEDPHVLRTNQNTSFKGAVILGLGFTFGGPSGNPYPLMNDLAAKNPDNKSRLFPYLGGEQLNDDPNHLPNRHVINFSMFPLRREPVEATWSGSSESQRKDWLRSGIVPEDYLEPVAADWPDLLDVVMEKVKPQRDADNRESRRRFWWRFGEAVPALVQAIEDLDRILVCSQTSKYRTFAFVPNGYVYDQKLIVFAESRDSAFAVMHSDVHISWALFFGSTMKDDPVYTPTDCFETFPFPSDWETNAALEEAGKTYYEYRAELMVGTKKGLTKTYNDFHHPEVMTPEVKELRRLHAAMDRAVLDAYGWTKIPTDCQFLLDYEEDEEEPEPGKKPRKKRKPWRYRWPDEIRDEVLARLLALNAERHEEEVALGIAPGMKNKATKKKTARKGNPPADPQQKELL